MLISRKEIRMNYYSCCKKKGGLVLNLEEVEEHKIIKNKENIYILSTETKSRVTQHPNHN